MYPAWSVEIATLGNAFDRIRLSFRPLEHKLPRIYVEALGSARGGPTDKR